MRGNDRDSRSGRLRQVCVLGALLCSVYQINFRAQNGPSPTPRDLTTRPAGPGTITGVATDDSGAHPLRRVDVTLNGDGFRSPDHFVTDDRGRFVFSSLPMGSYSLYANKPGYLTTYHGSRLPGRAPGRPTITLSSATPSIEVSLKMPRGAVITGLVGDPNGRPAQGVRIVLLQFRMNGGERQLVPASMPVGAMTDDRGMYRVYGLNPGEYLVRAVPSNMDAAAVAASDIQWAQQQVRQAQTPQGAGVPASPTAPQPETVRRPVTLAEIYYPGTPDAASAVPITLRAGEERAGIDFSLQYVAASRITALVMYPDGRGGPDAQLRLSQPGSPNPVTFNSVSRSADGTFGFSGVPPGQYRLIARTNPVPSPPPPPTGAAPAAVPPPAGPMLWGATDVLVNGVDLTNIVVALRPAMTMSGRLTFDSTATAPPQNLSNVRVSLTPTSSTDGIPVPYPSATVAADGTFTMTGIVPGRYRIAANGPSLVDSGRPAADWLLKSAVLNGQDISDRPFEITSDQPLQNVVLTWGDRPAELSGKLLDSAGRPATGYVVVLYTADRLYWGLQSRRTLRFPPAADGQFRFQGLLPGEYYISAVTDVETSDFSDPLFFEQIIDASLKITIGEGEKKVQDLRLAGAGTDGEIHN